MRVLIVGEIDGRLEDALRFAGMMTASADDGEYAIDLAKNGEFDCIVSDYDLNDMTGAAFARRLRNNHILAPIVILSKVAGPDSAVKTLSAGADDYIIRPFHITELIARVNACVRRSAGQTSSDIAVGYLTISLDARKAEYNGNYIPLSRSEYILLEVLVLRKGKIVTRESIIQHIYDCLGSEPDTKTIDVFLCKLRNKINVAAGETVDMIKTVWGRGYTLDSPTMSLAA